ncbi:polysaccharide pyruvyl transferase family protein [Metabacillus sp. 84]|uniref:polysaccharide pyruvyl transferase family protein n=1 Tax=Metabacillus sp. 84 TaxID=3404705 RepID=UPI003CF4B3EF
MSKKYKVLVFAYFEENLGDDLFLKVLFDRYPDAEWYMLESVAGKNSSLVNEYNLKFISKREFIKTFYKFDAMINIGGSIFIQTRRWYGLFLKRLFFTIPLKLASKKVFIIGANFGPFNSDLFKIAYNIYFKLINDICFRDEKSFKLFSKNKKVRLAPDIIYGYKSEREIPKKKNSVGISIMDLENRKELKEFDQAYINKMILLIEKLIENKNEVFLFSFCEKEGDLNAIGKIVNSFKEDFKKNIKVVNYSGNIDVFLEQFSSIEYIISLRFHSFILSQVYKQPVFPIVYSEKTLNALMDIQLDNKFIELRDIENLEISGIINSISDNFIDITEISASSENHFSEVDKLLGK